MSAANTLRPLRTNRTAPSGSRQAPRPSTSSLHRRSRAASSRPPPRSTRTEPARDRRRGRARTARTGSPSAPRTTTRRARSRAARSAPRGRNQTTPGAERGAVGGQVGVAQPHGQGVLHVDPRPEVAADEDRGDVLASPPGRAQDVRDRRAAGDLEHARPRDRARDGDEAAARLVVGAHLPEPVGAERRRSARGGRGSRRSGPGSAGRRPRARTARGPSAGIAGPPPIARTSERSSPDEVAAGDADDAHGERPVPLRPASHGERRLDRPGGVVGIDADLDPVGADGRGRGERAVEDEVRLRGQQQPVLAAGGLALRAVHDDDRPTPPRRDGVELRRGREPRSAPSEQSRALDLIDQRAVRPSAGPRRSRHQRAVRRRGRHRPSGGRRRQEAREARGGGGRAGIDGGHDGDSPTPRFRPGSGGPCPGWCRPDPGSGG